MDITENTRFNTKDNVMKLCNTVVMSGMAKAYSKKELIFQP